MKNIFTYFLVFLILLESVALGYFFYQYQTETEEEQVFVEEKPKYKNIILMIGDGMGYEHLLTADAYQESLGENLFMLESPYQNFVRTFPETTTITDSAASATTMATGFKSTTGEISQTPEGVELKTILEIAQENEMSTGLVSTKFINDATPAAFAAHEISRRNYQAIFEDMFLVSKPDVVIGGIPKGVELSDYQLGDYEMINDLELIQTDKKIAGFFDFAMLEMTDGGTSGEYSGEQSEGQIGERLSLANITDYSLNRLAENEEGFFLMVEGAKIDTESHKNDIARLIYEMEDFDNAVKTAYEFANSREDTILIVTADHETGGLVMREGFDTDGYPNVEWEGKSHTGRYVPLLSWQEMDGLVDGEVIDNTQIHYLMKNILLDIS
ncbi:hypothetical protein GF389_03970 [Candidatus Dojkabacteria bacterium]|nr:hypothetical protein [Candidatus Dojkabacteria bacterium]